MTVLYSSSSSSSSSSSDWDFNQLTFHPRADAAPCPEEIRESQSSSSNADAEDEISITPAKTASKADSLFRAVCKYAESSKEDGLATATATLLHNLRGDGTFENDPKQLSDLYLFVIQKFVENKSEANTLLDKAIEVYKEAKRNGVWEGFEESRLLAKQAFKA